MEIVKLRAKPQAIPFLKTIAMPPDYFDEYHIPLESTTGDSSRQSNNTNTTSAYDPYYAAPGSLPSTTSDAYAANPAWCQDPDTAMPDGGSAVVGNCDDSYTRRGSSTRTKSPTPTSDHHRRSSTRTGSTASSTSTKMSSSRNSVSSKSSAPSESSGRRKTRTSTSTAGGRHDSTATTMSSGSGDTNAKRDKFLERNRVAASKCRQRKKEWVSGLEEAKNGLETQNAHLQMEYNGLLGEVSRMKNQIMAHANCHDPNIDKWIENEARRFVQGQPPDEYPPPPGVAFGAFGNPGAPPFAVNYQGYPEDGE